MIKELKIRLKPGTECSLINTSMIYLDIEIKQAGKPKIVYCNLIDLLDFKSWFDVMWDEAREIILKSLNQQSNNQTSGDCK